MSRNLLRAGIVRRGFIKPVERLHEGLDFTYRPMPPVDVSEMESAAYKARETDPKGFYRTIAARIAPRLVFWSETNEDGSQCDISAANVLLLPLAIFERLRQIVSGVEATDEPPAPSEQDKADAAADATKEGFEAGLVKN